MEISVSLCLGGVLLRASQAVSTFTTACQLAVRLTGAYDATDRHANLVISSSEYLVIHSFN